MGLWCGAGKLWELWDCGVGRLTEGTVGFSVRTAQFCVCERRLDRTVLRPALLPAKSLKFIQLFRQV